jgi:hypothetical protein
LVVQWGAIGLGILPAGVVPGGAVRKFHYRVSQRPPAAPRWKQICPAEGVLIRSRRLFPW